MAADSTGAASAAPGPTLKQYIYRFGNGAAAALLWAHLSPSQRLDAYERHHFWVRGSCARLYKIAIAPRAVYDDMRHRFCMGPSMAEPRLPSEDVALANKLMLESDEENWRSIAKRIS